MSHTGSPVVRILADKTGLTSALSEAMVRPDVVYNRGAVMHDTAVAIADGATSISDLTVLRNQRRVVGTSSIAGANLAEQQ